MKIQTVLVLCALGCGRQKLELDGDLCPTPVALTAAPTGACNATSDELPDYGADYFKQEYDNPRKYDVVYSCSNPPASGAHFPTWGRWGVHEQPLPRSHYVHNLEHGGVALLYNCAQLHDGTTCADLVGRLEALLASWPADPLCDGSDVSTRILVTADPLLDVPVAAAAWEHIYRADCYDEASLTDFIATHYGHGWEDICSEGSV